MTHPAQSRCLPHVTCKFCGAGPKNGNQHDENCLINVPSAEATVIWRQGYDDAKRGQTNCVLGNSSVYLMGRRLAQKKASAERTTKSLEQAVEIARGLRP